MEKLGFMGQLFYKADKLGVATMVMSGASILAPAKRGDSLDAEKLARHIAARLQDVATMRMKFVQDPLGIGRVRKVENPEFDAWKHIDVKALPRPGGYRELTDALGAIPSHPLEKPQLRCSPEGGECCALGG